MHPFMEICKNENKKTYANWSLQKSMQFGDWKHLFNLVTGKILTIWSVEKCMQFDDWKNSRR